MTAQLDRKPEARERDEARRRREERELDEALDGTFPASDPPAIVQPTPQDQKRRKKSDWDSDS